MSLTSMQLKMSAVVVSISSVGQNEEPIFHVQPVPAEAFQWAPSLGVLSGKIPGTRGF